MRLGCIRSAGKPTCPICAVAGNLGLVMKQEPAPNKVHRLRVFRQQAYKRKGQAQDARMRLVAALPTDGMAETSNGSTIHYWQGLDVIAQSDGTNTKYFEYDGLGSVRQLTDSSGVVGLAQTFDPYGNPYVSSGSATTMLGFTGEQTDSNGFVFLRARYYRPSMGRFFQLDPSRQEQNAFAYSMGNPIMYVDWTGNIACVSGLTYGDIYAAEGNVARCEGLIQELSSFGVTVDFDYEAELTIAISRQIPSLERILRAVQSYDERLRALGLSYAGTMKKTRFEVWNTNLLWKKNYNPWNDKNQNTIAEADEIGQRTLLLTRTEWECQCPPESINCSEYPSKLYAINRHGDSGDGYEIVMAVDRLLNTSANEGVNLVAHELGHNLTYQWKSIPNVFDYDEYFGVDASSIAGDADEEYADGYASWALGNFKDIPAGIHTSEGKELDEDLLSEMIGCSINPAASQCSGQ